MKKKALFRAGAVLLLCAASFGFYTASLRRPAPGPLSSGEEALLAAALAPWEEGVLSPLPYPVIPKEFSLACRSVIVFDPRNGCVVYEKNADEVIPPASLAKLVTMYVLFQDMAAGAITLDDPVPLPPESWAVNAPPGSSLMFLSPDDRVTVRDLLAGMAVPSGNDAAVAAAYFAAGSVGDFCRRMNTEMAALGLTATRFVDPSGYSELNQTTAREFAAFLRVYLQKYGYGPDEGGGFPGALGEFHSRREMTHRGRVLRSTNTALQGIPGCDGVKTGYIPESGYNLALTVRRGNTRLAAVLLGGPGATRDEGNRLRLADAGEITRWVFGAFASRPPEPPVSFPVAVLGGGVNALNLVSACERYLTVPALADLPPEDLAGAVEVRYEVPRYLKAPLAAGTPCGRAVFSLRGVTLQEIPLVTDREAAAGNPAKRALDALAALFL
ncbi:MAG: D-alanyl-D-alanine carboxypeptidase [Spirochaetaceae bacterium]|jgi:D-alanyl-D-alanine carboxypeptidase (penicillin-binding protein 5/6)|nr:D-alanyl-D-alanine carboxypeptidase [Spirochaetaceae bacterium]